MILLINSHVNDGDGRVTRIKDVDSSDGFNLGLHLVAQALRQDGLEAKIIDGIKGKKSPAGLLRAVLEEGKEPVAFGISSTGMEEGLDRVIELSYLLKAEFPEIPVVVGGYVGLERDLISKAPKIDVVFLGEGDSSRATEVFNAIVAKDYSKLGKIPGLIVRTKPTEIIRTGKVPRVTDLTKVRVDYSLYQSNNIYSSRNCPQKCSFCYVRRHYGGRTVTSMNDKQLQDEVLRLIKERDLDSTNEHRTIQVGFDDDDFLCKSGRLRALVPILDKYQARVNFQTRADSILEHQDEIKKTKKYITRIDVGTEFFSQFLLDKWQKGVEVEDNLDAVRFLSEEDIPFTPYLLIDCAEDNFNVLIDLFYGLAHAPMHYEQWGASIPLLMKGEARMSRVVQTTRPSAVIDNCLSYFNGVRDDCQRALRNHIYTAHSEHSWVPKYNDLVNRLVRVAYAGIPLSIYHPGFRKKNINAPLEISLASRDLLNLTILADTYPSEIRNEAILEQIEKTEKRLTIAEGHLRDIYFDAQRELYS